MLTFGCWALILELLYRHLRLQFFRALIYCVKKSFMDSKMTENFEKISPRLNKLVVIGLGLIGASVAKAARERNLAAEVIGLSRRSSTLELALVNGVIDRAEKSFKDLAPELGSGDLVLIGVPTLTVPSVLRDCYELLHESVTLTDVASVKGSVVKSAQNIYGHIPPQLVPGHPIAGSEKSGVNAAVSNLFEGHRVILTPVAETAESHFNRVLALWEGVGAVVSSMDVSKHDEILAATSHLPHLLAFSLVDTLAGRSDYEEIIKFAAGGFRDFTRIAASDPIMWRDITLANKESILNILGDVINDFSVLRDAVRDSDETYLLNVFNHAQDARQRHEKQLKTKEVSLDKAHSFHVCPGGHACAELEIPGDKSISHRSVMLGSLAHGMTEVTGFLEGEDSLATLKVFRDLGVIIEGPAQGRLAIHGAGLHGLKKPSEPLYVGNSGTSMRLLSGILVGQNFDSILEGDASLSKRPMERIAHPLKTMGASLSISKSMTPPISIVGVRTLNAIDYVMPVASAQVKSCILLAGLYAKGITKIYEPAPTRDHTERMLRGFGYKVQTAGQTIVLEGGGTLRASRIDIPGDISSAAFFMVAAAITPGSDIWMKNIGVNDTRVGIINILRLMGTQIDLFNCREMAGEPVADIRVRYKRLEGIDIPIGQVPLAIDEFPAIFVAAACANGLTRLAGASELRVKESDRLSAMAEGLGILGISVLPKDDGIEIEGGQIGSGEIDSHGDHRVAMAFSIAALRATGAIIINDCENVGTSFPNFAQLAQIIGVDIKFRGAS